GLKLNRKVDSLSAPLKLTLFHVVIANHYVGKIQARLVGRVTMLQRNKMPNTHETLTPHQHKEEQFRQ
ncbi:hypothetical protein ACIPSD_18465, partial [Pectobacterium sp. CHL-2024]|uniref:hypothetical protein n=1 Tax=Pectobacterium sp. CHL-2024 TaxID=3377079 RepID=UPI003809E1A6